MGTYAPELALVRGQGCYVWDADGRKYLDFGAGISVCNLGHCHTGVTEAIQRQAATLVHVSNLYYNENQPRLAAVISRKSFGGKVFFANSGAEANEGMIKFARKWGASRGKHEVIVMQRSFHGRTLTTLAATDKPKYRDGFAPDMEGFRFVPLNDSDAVEKAVTDKTAAIMLEPVQGEGGVHVSDRPFLQFVRDLCDQRDMLLLFDEVQCGVGRVGTLFAYQHFSVVPDAMSLAKALGNGFPIGAFEVAGKWAGVLDKGTHASTFGGSPLACAAALAVFDAIEREDLLFHCRKMGEHLKGELVQLSQKHTCIREIRGLGLMIGVECDSPVADIVTAAAANGLLVLTAGETTLRLLPPLVVTPQEIDAAVAVLDKVLGSRVKPA